MEGRKRVKGQELAKLVNWYQPLIWSQIDRAAKIAGKPWRPAEITREAKKLNPTTFETLTEQVVGRWIDKRAKAEGRSQWRAAVLLRVKTGNSPGGDTTTHGILVSKMDTIMMIN